MTNAFEIPLGDEQETMHQEVRVTVRLTLSLRADMHEEDIGVYMRTSLYDGFEDQHRHIEQNKFLEILDIQQEAQIYGTEKADSVARVRYTVRSSHGELTADGDGYILNRHLDNDDDGGGRLLAFIERFDLAEWREHWGNPTASHIDILDVGYWYTDPDAGESGYEPPDSKWRSEIAEILLHRQKAAPVQRAALLDCHIREGKPLMGKPIHTPGPLTLNEKDLTIVAMESDCLVGEALPVSPHYSEEIREEETANGRLLTAAYNAFDASARKLGINAVEFAERMQEGGIAELVEALRDLLGDLSSVQSGQCAHCGRSYEGDFTADCPSDDCPSFRARTVIAKLVVGRDDCKA